MTIDALTSRIENTSAGNLETALIETYRLVPAEDTEQLDKVLDQMLGESAPPLDPKKLDRLEKTVQKFAENALAGNYNRPNSAVFKAKRLSWSVDIGDILDKMDNTSDQAPGFDRVAPLYITLYETLSKGLMENMFPEGDPFQALDYPQEVLLRSTAIANLEVDDSLEMVRRLMQIACSNPASPEISQRHLQRYLLPRLSGYVEDLDDALETAKSLSEESIQRLKSAPGSAITPDILKEQDTAKNLAELVLQIAFYMSSEDYLDCLDFYYAHTIAPDEISRAVALAQALETIDEQMDPPECKDDFDEADEMDDEDKADCLHAWVSAYEDGLRRGIQPRADLREHYTALKEQLSR